MASGVELATAYVSLSVSTRGLGRDIKREFDGVERQAQASGKRIGGHLSGGMAVIGGAAATGVAALVTGLGVSIKKAADFDKTMRTVGATLGASGPVQQELSNLAIKLGKDTAFSAAEAGEAMLELAKGGMTAVQIRSGALSSTLTLASAGGLALGDAATYMSNALNTFGLPAKDASKVAAALAGAANASTASVESMGQALSQVGPGAKTAGLSLQTTTGILAAFDNAGIKGSDAGTSLKTMLTRLVPSTDKAAGAMADLGLKFTDANGKFKPMTDIAQQLQDKLKGLSDEQKTTALATIFGADATRAATVLADLGAKGVAKYTKATSDQGAAQRMAKTATEGVSGAWEAFQGTIETVAVTLGQKLLPFVEKVIRGANDLAGAVLDNMGPALDILGKIPEALQAGFSGDLSSFDGILGVFAQIGDSVGVLYDYFNTDLPVAIDTAQGAFSVVSDFIESRVVPRVTSIIDAIRGFVDVALPVVRDFVKGMIERIQPLMPTIREIFGTIGDIITGALDLIKAIIERVTAVIAFIWQRWGQGIMDFIAVVWQKVLAIIQPALEGVKALIRTFTAIFKGDWKAAWESFKTVFTSAWKIVRGAIDLAMTVLAKGLSVAWSGIVTTAGRIWDGITEAIAGPLDRVMEFIQENFIDKINGLFSFLRIPVHITPIWKASNVGSGMVNAGREFLGRGGSRRSEGGTGGALPSGGSGGGLSRPVSQPVGTGFGGYPGHKGVDFLTPIGTPVRSLMSGTVVRDGWDPGGFGYHVRTRDADGDMTIFGHLTRDVVSVGQQIAKGQVIGYSGNTGNSTGPHLHVERRDPPYSSASAYNWLTGAGAPAGAGFNPIADLLRNGIASIASGASGFASQVGGPFGPVFANILERLVKGVGARGLSLLGIEGGELRPRLYDQGGMIPPGDTLVRNLTGRPETLLPFDIRQGGAGREVHIHLDGAGLSPDDLVAAAYRQERRDAALHRNYAVR